MVKRGQVNLRDSSKWRTIGDEADKIGRVRVYTKQDVFFAPVYIADAANRHKGDGAYTAAFFVFPSSLATYQDRYNRRRNNLLDPTKAFDLPNAKFGSNVYGDGCFFLTINAYGAWTESAMNGARLAGSRDMIPYPKKTVFKDRWALLNKFCHNYIQFFPFHETKDEALKRCMKFCNDHCDWDEIKRVVTTAHVDKCVSYMRSLSLRACFMEHLQELKDKQLHDTLRGPFGGKTFIDEKKALNVFYCVMKHLAPETLSDEIDSLVSIHMWLRKPSTGKRTKARFKWLFEMEIVETSEAIIATREAMMKRNPLRMNCLMYLHHKEYEEKVIQEKKALAEQQAEQHASNQLAKDKARDKQNKHWEKVWQDEDANHHQFEHAHGVTVDSILKNLRAGLPLDPMVAPSDKQVREQLEILKVVRMLIENIYYTDTMLLKSFVDPNNEHMQKGLTPNACYVGFLLAFFKSEWIEKLTSAEQCYEGLANRMPPPFFREFSVYMESFLELSLCTDPEVREKVYELLTSSAERVDKEVVEVPLAKELVLQVSRYLYEHHAVEFKTPPFKRHKPVSRCDPKDDIDTDLKPASRYEGTVCTGSALNLWSIAGAKGLNKTEAARTVEIEKFVRLFGDSEIEDDDKPDVDTDTEENAPAEVDWYHDWDEFCTDFDRTGLEDPARNNNKKKRKVTFEEAKEDSLSDSDGLSSSLGSILSDSSSSRDGNGSRQVKSSAVPKEVVLESAETAGDQD